MKLLTTREASDYLNIGISTLERWRFNSVGPAYVMVGTKTVRYRVEDLDRFYIVRNKHEPIDLETDDYTKSG